jgi:hypothetical protein
MCCVDKTAWLRLKFKICFLLLLDITACFNEYSQIQLENQSDKFISDQLQVVKQPCIFIKSNHFYQAYDFYQPSRFCSRTELAEITTFDDPSCFQKTFVLKQSVCAQFKHENQVLLVLPSNTK